MRLVYSEYDACILMQANIASKYEPPFFRSQMPFIHYYASGVDHEGLEPATARL